MSNAAVELQLLKLNTKLDHLTELLAKWQRLYVDNEIAKAAIEHEKAKIKEAEFVRKENARDRALSGRTL